MGIDITKLSDAPITEEEHSTAKNLIRLLRVVASLRDPEHGCPWDKEQTHQTLRSYLIEETYEAVEAIDLNSPEALSDELGDVLLQVALHGQLGGESHTFTFNDIVKKITKKMIDRHPHVFGEVHASTSKEVLENWETLKAKENTAGSTSRKKLSEKISTLPPSLPALLTAERIGEKSARWGFDWSSLSEVYDKVKEEFKELDTEVSTLLQNAEDPYAPLPASKNESLHAQSTRIGEEIGDCLFTLTQIARWLGLSAEDLLRDTHKRFLSRIKNMEEHMPDDFLDSSREDKERAWDLAKENLKSKNSF
jgi:tetrapyrrole methylase family protein / MazG family protein